ncbi:receptor-type tyrosine-protein phosphatase O isoform X2 [Misgurnus anguillicaudatus]|uniref:receptor-type tyrosine-protein phosphatase O isoform X2 n=1 Tax=Misgurnus anguillicaudatus TaxID=75329 RepID=UPI002434B60A|nr:receptor-type tyrosine-protein phosphatase O isoform X2 [Misgurnus anguillicaudatus]
MCDGPNMSSAVVWSALLATIVIVIQSVVSFQVEFQDEIRLLMRLDADDVRQNVSMYTVRVSGEPHTHTLVFSRPNNNQTLPEALLFNISYHGLCYTISLLLGSNTKPVQTVTLFTKPLPLDSVQISDYGPSPETAVVFHISSPERNVYTRVNISYTEGHHQRYMLYKDFFKGKTVFKHWLSGTCYSNITFQLISEVTVNRTTLMKHSDITHEPQYHRTVPNPPLNVSFRIIHLSERGSSAIKALLRASHNASVSRRTREVSSTETNSEEMKSEVLSATVIQTTVDPSENLTHSSEFSTDVYLTTAEPIQENNTDTLWTESTGSPAPTEVDEFVNGLIPEYEDSNEPGSAMNLNFEATVVPTPPSPILLELRWLPPSPPTSFDGFNIYIYRDGNITETATVDENTHEFFSELSEAGTYRIHVSTLSSSGDCEPRESSADTGFTFYLSPSGEWMAQPQERPQAVSVKMLDSSTAAVSWAPSAHKYNSSLISVMSLTCLQPSISQRMESTYCSEENITSDVITNLMPGAQYRVMVYHTNGPLISPPSEPVIIDIEPTGVRDLVVYPLSPTAVILSWQRPYNVAFRKYVLQTFFFNSAAQTSQWTTYYEIAATASVIASVRVTDLLPAWYYNFRVTMVTWGDPPLSCCDSSTVSFVTAPEAPHISSVDYSHGMLYVRWTYGDLFTDLSHSRMLHWQVVAEGRKGSRRRYTVDVTRNMMKASLALPPGDIYNLTVTACTERSRNTSLPHIMKLDPAPPKSLYAVNTTDTAVTLLWTEDGVVDFYQIVCRQLGLNRQQKVREPLVTASHVLTVSGLQPSTSYNCSVISMSYSSSSEPVHISITTSVREMNPSVAAISALAVLSVLLISLLVLFLLVLRKKHMELNRECAAETFVNFASFERDGKLPYNWRRSLFAFLTLLPSCLWTDYLLAFYINPWSKTALKKRKLTSPVQLSDFETYIKDMSRDSAYKFSLQFEELKSVGLDLTHEAADMPINRPKNRYTNILPYDFSRVKLISLHNDEGSDYINANYIPGYNSPHEYIATQGPLPDTRNDFWKMVLQQKSHIIVMLTQCNERRRVKCDHYWPFTEEPVACGEVTVEMMSETESPEWTIRNFRLGYADETQDVLHFNYTSWPDHGVPTVNAIESILQFVQIVRQQVNRTKGPIIVHCSAGVGRTGTFIALDRLMQHIQEHEYVDILGLVSEMRSHRLSMVQTEEQYVFIHQCVLLMWKKKKHQSHTSDVIYENVSKS